MWWLRKKKFSPQEGDTSFVDTSGGIPTSESTPSADESTDSDVNWTQLDKDFTQADMGEELAVEGDSEIIPESVEPAPAAASAPAAAPTTPATSPTPAPVVAPTETPPVAAPTPAATTPAAPPAEASPTPDYAAWRAQRETDLAAQMYSISDEDASKLLTEPETVLPRMAARMHMEVMESTVRAMQHLLPRMMQSIQHNEQREISAKSFFQTANPDLADPSFEPAIMEMGQVYRRLNPSASPEQAAQAIGNLVRASLGIAMPVQSTQAAPSAPVVPVVPFTPARGGPGGALAGGAKDSWGQLADEFLAEDN